MTVANESSRKTFTGDAVTTSFATSPVVFFETSNLVVSVVTTATGAATTLTENTHYTVTGGDGSTGTVNLAGGSAPYGAPSAAQTLVIVRDLPLTQSADPDNGDSSDAEVIEEAADRLTMMAQQLQRQLDGAFRLADTDVSGADATIPTPVASRLIGWNGTATALQNYAAADIDLALVSAFAQTLLDDTDAAEARTTLAAAGTGAANTFTADQTLQSSDAGATAGPVLTLDRSSASPAASDVTGVIKFNGKDSGGNATTYAQLLSYIYDPTNGSEDGDLEIQTMVAGTAARRVLVRAGLVVGAPTTGDMGAGKVNTTGYYLNGYSIGGVAQIVTDEDAAYSSVAATIPYDDTIPQVGEGSELLSAAITPKNASSTLMIEASFPFNPAGNAIFIAALFKDGAANAIASNAVYGTTNGPVWLTLRHKIAAGSTSAQTFAVRIGSGGGTAAQVNGYSAARVLGGVETARLTITEVLP